MVKLFFLVIFLTPMVSWKCWPQETRVVFYNVENLFDTEDDPLTEDDEFLPEGVKHWNNERYWRKVVRIYQVITALGAGQMPSVIGLCEIENRRVLEKLVFETPLERYQYRILHQDSPDARGVDVAIIYRPDLYNPQMTEWIPVNLPDGGKTRDILHVRGLMLGNQVLHLYINHWPSRYGGIVASQAGRMAAAMTLRSSLVSIMQEERQPNVIIMGDFNDEPGDASMKRLCALMLPGDQDQPALINLSSGNESLNHNGTIKHQGYWSAFDQVIISAPLADGSWGLVTENRAVDVFRAGFLLEPDETHTGYKPFRTYYGPGYHGGFSDHLPVSITLKRTQGTGFHP